jgi:hypothetical protein
MIRLRACLTASILALGSVTATAQPASDPPELQRLYDEGMAALADHRDAEAADKLEQVARESVDPLRRDTAAKLAAEARGRLAPPPEPLPPPGALPPPTTPAIDEEAIDGRTTLMAGLAGLGLGFYGFATPIILDVDDAQQAVGLYLVTAAATIFVPYLATRDEPVTLGMATLATAGGALGVAHGMLLYVLAAGDNPSARGLFATGAAVSLAELGAGYVVARKTNMSAGHAGSIAAGGAFGAGWALAGDALIAGDKIEEQDRGLAGVALAGSIGGALIGDQYARHRTLSAGDASVVSLGGMVGLYASVGPLLIAEVDSVRAVAGTILGSHLLGLVVGDRLIDGKDFSRSDAGRVGMFTLGGALLGMGGIALTSPKDDPEKHYALGLSIGLVAGYVGGALLTDARPDGALRGRGGPIVSVVPMMMPNQGMGAGVTATW